jgi:hypothetical protein
MDGNIAYVVMKLLSVIIICFLCCHMCREPKWAAHLCAVRVNFRRL